MIPRVKIDLQGTRSSIFVHAHYPWFCSWEASYRTQPLQSTHFHTNNLPRVAVMQLAVPIAK